MPRIFHTGWKLVLTAIFYCLSHVAVAAIDTPAIDTMAGSVNQENRAEMTQKVHALLTTLQGYIVEYFAQGEAAAGSANPEQIQQKPADLSAKIEQSTQPVDLLVAKEVVPAAEATPPVQVSATETISETEKAQSVETKPSTTENVSTPISESSASQPSTLPTLNEVQLPQGSEAGEKTTSMTVSPTLEQDSTTTDFSQLEAEFKNDLEQASQSPSIPVAIEQRPVTQPVAIVAENSVEQLDALQTIQTDAIVSPKTKTNHVKAIQNIIVLNVLIVLILGFIILLWQKRYSKKITSILDELRL